MKKDKEKKDRSQVDLIEELYRKIEFLSDELECRTMEISSKESLVRSLAESEKTAMIKKEQFNKEALQLKQDNSELIQVIDSMKREKKELVSIFETKKKDYEDIIAQLTKSSQNINPISKKATFDALEYRAGNADLQDDIQLLQFTIKSKEEAVQIITGEQNELKADLWRIQRALSEVTLERDSIIQEQIQYQNDVILENESEKKEREEEKQQYEAEINRLVLQVKDLLAAVESQNEVKQPQEGDEIINHLRQQIEDERIEKQIIEDKLKKEQRSYKEVQKLHEAENDRLRGLLSESNKEQEKYQEEIKFLKEKLQKKILDIPNPSLEQIPVANAKEQISNEGKSNNIVNSMNLNNNSNTVIITNNLIQQQQQQQIQPPKPLNVADIRKEKKILEALSQRVNDLTQENSMIKQQLTDQAGIIKSYEKVIAQKEGRFINFVKEVKLANPSLPLPSSLVLSNQQENSNQQNSIPAQNQQIQSFKEYQREDLLVLVEELFIENLLTKQQMRAFLMSQKDTKQTKA